MLNPRERRIFEARRLAEEPITLEELSAEFGVSRERVRQIEVRAFEKELYAFIDTRHPQLFRDIAEKKQLDDQLKATLTAAVKEFAGDFASRKAAAA